MQTVTREVTHDDPLHPERRTTTTTTSKPLRTGDYHPPRRRWPGVLAACVLGVGIGALAVSSLYDKRTVGERLDATVAATQQGVQDHVADLRTVGSEAARDGAAVTDRAASALTDTRITAAVKTALAADPKLSAVKIDVKTNEGVVSLEGPAPDETSRERAQVLAAAPEGVQRVDNRLVVVPPRTTVQ